MSIKWNNVKQQGQSKVKKASPTVDLGIGPTELIAGDMQAGFFGEVLASELFTGPELASEINLTAGIAQYDNEPWLKFAYKGEILYVAKKPYRHTVSWDDIQAVDAVYGGENDAEVGKSGYNFKVRLLKGASNDPTSWDDSGTDDEGASNSRYDPVESIGSEWNNLIYKVHEYSPVNQEGSNWANYTDSDIVVGSGDGRVTWCQETPSYDTSRRVHRGNSSLSYFITPTSSYSPSICGWRPCLTLIT
ncbi:hypothetical protein PBI_SCTP2_486 [Salicola phage SCTP-2]|nr:hypothetical protein PBI_SCTP2_486 [Salicola phage SCTP-2]